MNVEMKKDSCGTYTVMVEGETRTNMTFEQAIKWIEAVESKKK